MLHQLRQSQSRLADRRAAAREQHGKVAEAGFTLIELLIVIVILGILAAVVVFSVRGITNKGQDAACQADFVTVQNAEEAAYAGGASGGSKYLSMADLVSDGYLSSASNYFTATTTSGSGYKIAATTYNGVTCTQSVTVNGG
jgi:general secretion pathway protein G